MKKRFDWLRLVLSIILCQVAALVGSLFTTPNIDTWYAGINKPFFTPPNWLFAPVWTVLFLMMGVSLYLLVSSKNNKKALIFFGIQLGLNVLWSVLFFGIQNPGLAFIEIILLWSAILATIIFSCKVNRTASLLLVPYIIWVSFAAILNYSIWMLN